MRLKKQSRRETGEGEIPIVFRVSTARILRPVLGQKSQGRETAINRHENS